MLWVVALGVWAGVSAGPIGGPWGVVAGSVLTVLAGVVTAYVPSLPRGVPAAHRRAEAGTGGATPGVRAVPAAVSAGRWTPPGAGGCSPAGSGCWLGCWPGARAISRAVATGTGRWVGKTRLSVELEARLEPRGWRCVRVWDGEEALALHSGAAAVVGPGAAGGGLCRDPAAAGRAAAGSGRGSGADGCCCWRVARASGGIAWPPGAVVLALLAEADGSGPLPVAVSGELSNIDLVLAAVPVFAAALRVAPSGSAGGHGARRDADALFGCGGAGGSAAAC